MAPKGELQGLDLECGPPRAALDPMGEMNVSLSLILGCVLSRWPHKLS